VIPTLETERLILSEWTPADVDEYARICSDPVVMRYMWPARAATPAESAYGVKLLEEHWLQWGFGHWAVHEKDTGRFVGRTGIKRHPDWEPDPDNTEVGWLYDRAVWGRGYATEGAREAVRFCLEEVGRPEVISIAHPDNVASRRVMAKVGMTYAGARHWDARGIDVVWYSVKAAPHDPKIGA
jgi:RimJ/RimL family protein N-acetyltransferase